MTIPVDALPTILLFTFVENDVDPELCTIEDVVVAGVVVFVITIGVYPGAETVPPEIIVSCFCSVAVFEDDVVVTYTSRIGAPRFIYPVANFSVC